MRPQAQQLLSAGALIPDPLEGRTPIATYTMDNISGTTLIDDTGTYDATLNGNASVPGVVGNALDFDGTNDYVTMPSIPSITAMSFYMTSGQTGTLKYLMDSDGVARCIVAPRGNSGSFEFYDGTAWRVLGPHINDTFWHKVYLIETAGSLDYWVDDVLINTVSVANFRFDGTFKLGRHSTSSLSFFNGNLDELVYYT